MTGNSDIFQLMKGWKAALNAFEGPGEAEIVEGSPMEGICGGLIVREYKGSVHHFRLYRDETVEFIESTQNSDQSIMLDPMFDPCNDDIYLSAGVPPAVTARFEVLGVTPRWSKACPDGEHQFEIVNEGSVYAFFACEKCKISRATLSWLGHAVPAKRLK